MVVDDALDVALLLEELDGAAGERAVDLHAVNEDRLRDELVGRDLLEDAVAEALVTEGERVGVGELVITANYLGATLRAAGCDDGQSPRATH